MKAEEILSNIELLFPNAKCELNHKTPFQLLIAVVLSAQTTDVRVNIVTKDLFNDYPDAERLSKADFKKVQCIIKSLGLSSSKTKNIICLSIKITENFNGEVPSSLEDLMSLDGVGRKTANVVLSEWFKIPAIAVDTHVERVSKRLKMVPSTKNVMETEKILMRKIDRSRWSKAHHLLIFFGRYQCKAQRPLCDDCPFQSFCRYYHDHHKKTR